MRLGAILLLALFPLPGADWRELLDAGLVAEDSGQYGEARPLLSRACSEAEFDPAALRESCLALARVHALAGDLDEADGVLGDAVEKLRTAGSAPNTVLALLQWSEVQAARGDLPDAGVKLDQAKALFPSLGPVERASALTEMGSIYLAVKKRRIGMPLLYRVQAELLSSLSLDDPAAVEALAKNAAVLTQNNRAKDAGALLEPVIESARRAFAEPDSVSGDLYRAYMNAVREYGSTLSHRSKKQEIKAFREETRQWERGAGDVIKVESGVVTAPRLTRRVDPNYTSGAKAAGATGVVILMVEIWPDGRVHNIRVLKPLSFGLSWNAIAAVRQWRFTPGTRLGEPVKVAAQIEVNFKLR